MRCSTRSSRPRRSASPASRTTSPSVPLADAVVNLEKRPGAQDYAAGDRFTAADTQLGSALHYGTNIFGALPRLPVFQAYLHRLLARPTLQQCMEKDEALATQGSLKP